MKKRKRQTKEQIKRERLLPLGDQLYEILKPVYDKHHAETNCRDCAEHRTWADVRTIIGKVLRTCCPNVSNLCTKHQAAEDAKFPDPPGRRASTPPEDDDLPI